MFGTHLFNSFSMICNPVTGVFVVTTLVTIIVPICRQLFFQVYSGCVVFHEDYHMTFIERARCVLNYAS